MSEQMSAVASSTVLARDDVIAMDAAPKKIENRAPSVGIAMGKMAANTARKSV